MPDQADKEATEQLRRLMTIFKQKATLPNKILKFNFSCFL